MRRRLLVAMVGVSAVALALLAVPLALVLQRSYEDEELLKLQRDVVAATRQIDLSGRPGDAIELPQGFATVAAFNRSGELVAGTPPAGAQSLVDAALASGRTGERHEDGRLEAAVPLVSGEHVSGVVVAARDDAVVDTRTADAWLLIGCLAVAIAAIAATVAFFVSRRLSHPLEALANASERLGDGDFSARADHSGIPEVDVAGRALNSTAMRLGKLVAREREFSADASHQLRTPLAALRLELEAGALAGAPAGSTERALAEVDRIEATVVALLAAARDDPGGHGPASLPEAFDELRRRWHGPLAERGRQLRLDRDRDLAVAPISPAVLSEILGVLLENAVVHGAGAVTVHAEGGGDRISIVVGDEGTGFRGDLEKAFERRSASSDGHGVGLALARSLARAEGADLWVARARPPLVQLLLAGMQD